MCFKIVYIQENELDISGSNTRGTESTVPPVTPIVPDVNSISANQTSLAANEEPKYPLEKKYQEQGVESKQHVESKEHVAIEVKENDEVCFFPRSGDTSNYVEIPNILSFVWVGNPLPVRYKDNLLDWRKLNPHYEINLWADGHLLTKEEFEAITKICADIHINIVNIVDKIKDPRNATWYKRDLGEYYDNVIGENRNWAIASNFLRALILEELGGIYLDTDIFPKGRRLPLKIKVPPHGLILNPINPPDDAVPDYVEVTELADSIIASTKGNKVMTEFYRVMKEKYQEYLSSNVGVVTLRSRVLSEIEGPTYKTVGPGVLAEAFANIELAKIPFDPNQDRKALKEKLLDEIFNNEEVYNFFDDYFIERSDQTWTNMINTEFFNLYDAELLRDVMGASLKRALTKAGEGGQELSPHLEKIRRILSVRNYGGSEKVENIRQYLIEKDTKLWAEIDRYFRPGYFATLVINVFTKEKKLLQYKENKQWPEFIALLERMEKEKKSFADLEEPRKFDNPILQAAAKDQHKTIHNILSQRHCSERYLDLVVSARETNVAKQLMKKGIKCYKTGNYHCNAFLTAINTSQFKLAHIMLRYILGDLKDSLRKPNKYVVPEILQNRQLILFQVGDYCDLPIKVTYFSFTHKKVVRRIVNFCRDFADRGDFEFNAPCGQILNYNSLKDVVEYIKSYQKQVAKVIKKPVAPAPVAPVQQLPAVTLCEIPAAPANEVPIPPEKQSPVAPVTETPMPNLESKLLEVQSKLGDGVSGSLEETPNSPQKIVLIRQPFTFPKANMDSLNALIAQHMTKKRCKKHS